MAASKTLEIIIKARDQASGVFRQAGQGLQDLRKKALSVDGGGGLGNAEKSLANLGKIAAISAGIQATASAIDASASGIEAAVATWKGDIQAADKAMVAFADKAKAIPFGVGAVFGAGQTIRGLIDRWLFGEKTPEELAAGFDVINKRVEQMQRRIAATVKIIESTGTSIEKLRRQVELMQITDPAARSLQEARNQADDQLAEAQARAQEGLKTANNSQREQIKKQLAEEIKLIQAQYTYRTSLITNQKLEQGRIEAQALSDSVQKEKDAEQSRLQSLEDLRLQARQLELQNQGQFFQAQREAIEAEHQRRLRTVKDQAEREALERIRAAKLAAVQTAQIRDEEAKRQREADRKKAQSPSAQELARQIRGSVSVIELSRQFSGDAARFNSRLDPVAENTRRSNDLLANGNRLLQSMFDGIKTLVNQNNARNNGLSGAGGGGLSLNLSTTTPSMGG